MLIEKLRSWDYYYDKLPLYFKNDDRIEEHFHALFDFLVQNDDTYDVIIKSFDVMADGYLDFINSIDESVDKDQSDILEKIAAIYGVTRDFGVEVDGVKKQLHLNNKELLTLVKACIIQSSYDGTFKTSKQFYESVGLQVMLYTKNDSAHASLYLIDDGNLTQNFIDMFKAGLFTIKSIGIQYDYTYIQNLDELFMFDLGDNHVFDVGLWF